MLTREEKMAINGVLGQQTLDAVSLRRGFSMFPSGVAALCALVDGRPVGMAASTFTPVSLDPPLVSICIAHTSGTWRVLREQPRLGISVLGADHRSVVRQLASRDLDRFVDIDYKLAGGSAIILHGAAMSCVCSVERELSVGDHDIVVLAVHCIDPHPDIAPIVFHASSFHQLAAS